MTAAPSLSDLEAAVYVAREQRGRGSSQELEAFHALCAGYAARGRRIDELRTYSPDEEERFFANTAQGPDGHVFWLPEQSTPRFRRNDGQQRTPGRWWWELRHGAIGTTTLRVIPTCGDLRCINPEHAKLEHMTANLVYPEHKIIGGLQVLAARLGRSPNARDWDRAKLGISTSALFYRFPNWAAVLRLAGMEKPRPPHAIGPAEALAALRLAHEHLGWWPSYLDLKRNRRGVKDRLQAAGLPVAPEAIKRQLGGSWAEALRRAGKRG